MPCIRRGSIFRMAAPANPIAEYTYLSIPQTLVQIVIFRVVSTVGSGILFAHFSTVEFKNMFLPNCLILLKRFKKTADVIQKYYRQDLNTGTLKYPNLALSLIMVHGVHV